MMANFAILQRVFGINNFSSQNENKHFFYSFISTSTVYGYGTEKSWKIKKISLLYITAVLWIRITFMRIRMQVRIRLVTLMRMRKQICILVFI